MWQRRDDWIGSEVEDSFVMINLEHGAYVDLNHSAAYAWDLLAVPRDEDGLVAAMLARYAVDADHCRAMVQALLIDMADKELIAAVG